MLFVHVGLHKTGTTYFQSEVFPRWKGLKYVRHLTLENFLKIDPNVNSLVSREGYTAGVVAHAGEKLIFLKRLSRMLPDARILISFRSHSSYLNAIYSQYLRYGGTLEVGDFFDLESDNGYMKRADLTFRSYVDGISEYWGRPPFVFLLSELKESKDKLFKDLGDYFGVPAPSLESIGDGRRNVSLGAGQAEVLRKINKWSGVELHRDGSTRPYRLLRRLNLDPPNLCQRWSELRPSGPSVHADMARRIDEHFAADWRYLKDCTSSRDKLVGK